MCHKLTFRQYLYDLNIWQDREDIALIALLLLNQLKL